MTLLRGVQSSVLNSPGQGNTLPTAPAAFLWDVGRSPSCTRPLEGPVADVGGLGLLFRATLREILVAGNSDGRKGWQAVTRWSADCTDAAVLWQVTFLRMLARSCSPFRPPWGLTRAGSVASVTVSQRFKAKHVGAGQGGCCSVESAAESESTCAQRGARQRKMGSSAGNAGVLEWGNGGCRRIDTQHTAQVPAVGRLLLPPPSPLPKSKAR